MVWIVPALERDKLRADLNVVMNLQFSYSVENFLTS
jgi:hypothetical protein